MTEDLTILDSKNATARVVLIAVAIFVLVFGWFAVRWQFGNLFADLARADDPNAMEIADLSVTMAPSDPLTNWLKATLEKNNSTPEKTAYALKLFEETVRLSPYDFRWWIELGRAYEQADKPDLAESALRHAVELAPAYTYPHWQLGNFYLRQDRGNEAFAELKRTTENNQAYREQVFSLAWDYFDRDPAKLEQLVSDQPDAYASLALFYGARGRAADSLRIWNLLSAEDKATHPQILKVVAQGLYEKRYFPQALEFARQLGIDADAQPGAVTNAGFEKPVGNAAESRFGWQVVRNDSKLDVSGDSAVRHGGTRSLKVTFRNYTKPDLYNIFQTIVVEPNKNYRLRFWVRTENLKSSGAPLVEVINGNDDKLLASSKAFPTGTNDWQEFIVEFTTTGNCSGITIRTARSFCGDACPIVGIFWYDDFELSGR